MSLNFVSEDTLEAKRKQRQEEWEKVRTAEDPVEAPEEEVDDRSLYHRLQEQKMAKEAEKAEEHKLRNMVQGLKKDETDFLDFVATKQMQHNREKEKEEENLLKEIEEARGKLDEESSSSSSPSMSAKSKATSGAASKSTIVGASKRTNQSALLAGVVVKKKPRTSSSGESEAERNGKTTSPPVNPSGRGNDADDDGADDDSKDVEGTGVAKVIGVLPGIGEYTDSSESDSEHEEETISTKHLGFMKLKKKQKKNGGGE